MSTLQALLQGETGLDLGQLDTLEHLVLGGAWRMSDLAEAMRVDASTATRAIARLVDTGFAERSTDPADARCVQVAATPLGVARYDEVADGRRTKMVEMIEHMELDDRRRLAHGMEQLVAALDAWVAHKSDVSAEAR
jgi:DNA-binding MarR family transcriptional regulator